MEPDTPTGYDEQGNPVPLELCTPEERCAFLEEHKKQFTDEGLHPDDVYILIAYTLNIEDLS
jgi:hypothetical protein